MTKSRAPKARKVRAKLRAKRFIDVPREVYYASPDLLARIARRVRRRDLRDLVLDAWGAFVGHPALTDYARPRPRNMEQFRADAAATAVFLAPHAKFSTAGDRYSLVGSWAYFRASTPWLDTLRYDAARQMAHWLGRLDCMPHVQRAYDELPVPGLLVACPDLVDKHSVPGVTAPGVRSLRARELGLRCR